MATMKNRIFYLSRSLRTYWKYYLMQTLLSVSVLFIILLLLTSRDMVVIASIGATSFIIYAMPHAKSAMAKAVLPSYVAGLVFGSVFALIPVHNVILLALVYSMSVGCTIFFMLVTDAKHPPAASVTLGVALTGFQWEVAIAVLGSAVILSIAHHFSKHLLLDFSGFNPVGKEFTHKHENRSQNPR
ncbi:TPA: HPP family protein [Candidatus Marinimicrobia bacterium]|nr:HPP family protein [Candidatus Neomarinimicrobiota bacterium]HBY17976.1 HPP family protein [Candidatus Neomarinimicrobiota bacterium]